MAQKDMAFSLCQTQTYNDSEILVSGFWYLANLPEWPVIVNLYLAIANLISNPIQDNLRQFSCKLISGFKSKQMQQCV